MSVCFCHVSHICQIFGNVFQEPDVHRYFREACMILGEAAVERGDLEHALKLFSQVETSHAAWNEAQV